MSILTTSQEEIAKCWLNDLFQSSGRVSPSQDIRDSRYWLMQRRGSSGIQKNAAEIVDTIFSRSFKNLNDAFDYFSSEAFGFDKLSANYGYKKPDMLARYVAWFCEKAKIYWDNSLLSKEEMDEFLRTYLGRALDTAGCFASSADPVAKSFGGGKTRAASTRTPGAAPAIGYKASGAHSETISNLVGTPHEKVKFPGGNAYCVVADKTGKNVPCAFITPLSSAGEGYPRDRAERVNMGSGNGYTDCCCWFDNSVDADAFCLKCREKFDSKFTGITVGRKTPDSNGYFAVTTEFGPAYIKASKLNEEILFGKEPVEESVENIEESTGGVKISKEDYMKLFEHTKHID